MQRQLLHSGNLKSVGYDPHAHILEVEFHGDGLYRYFDVPEALYVKLLQAPSHGAYFHTHIKNRYLCCRVQ
jgi:hypothetical protein